MANISKNWIDNWGRVRQQGVWRFILVRGLLAFGLTFGALSFVIDYFLSSQPFDIIKFCARVIVGGLVFGALMWNGSERKYRKYIERRVP